MHWGEGFDQGASAQSAIDFITGLRQFREEKAEKDEEDDDLAEVFDRKMDVCDVSEKKVVEEAVDIETFKPKFISKKVKKGDVQMKEGKDQLQIGLEEDEEVASKEAEDSQMK